MPKRYNIGYTLFSQMPLVTYEADGRVAYLTLNRPEQRNALSGELLADFRTALDAFAADERPRVAILRGAGPSFCAGFDLTPTSASVRSTVADPWRDRQRLLGWIRLALAIWEFPRPIIAQVHGHCLAGGILLPMCSDLVFAAEDCVLGWPRLPVGAGFMDGAMSLLIGQRRAKELAYVVGSRITGREAAAWGFVNVALPADELAAGTEAFARRMAKAPRSVLEIRKAAITRAQLGLSFRDAMLAGVEWDVIAHGDPAVDEMRARVRTHGMKTVIAAFESADDEAALARLDEGD
jgi:enoyl-CoA hydratase